MAITLIAAVDDTGALGRQGSMAWHHREELRHFKEYTLGKTILMGRATYESIGRPLPKRRTVVLTKDKSFHPGGVEVLHTFTNALALGYVLEELVVCGGASVYRQFLPEASKVVLSHVPLTVEGADVWFPKLQPGEWRLTREEQEAGFTVEYWETLKQQEVPYGLA